MGQAASMCRFRGCRYKKDKINKALQQNNHLQQQQHLSSPILTSSSSSSNEFSKDQQKCLAVTSKLPPGEKFSSILILQRTIEHIVIKYFRNKKSLILLIFLVKVIVF